ncbi:MAG: hypothetical protein V4556_08605 [Bacteroidota bacterium]
MTLHFYSKRKIVLSIECLIISFFICLGTFAQKQNPPGTIFLKDNMYIDEIPICNLHFREYKYSLGHSFHYNIDSLEKVVQTLPYLNFDIGYFLKYTNFAYNTDSSKCLIADTVKTFWNNWTDFKTYLNNPRFNFFPVVNISQETATNFCKWRTYMVKIFNASQQNEKDRKEKFEHFEYRLATNEELALASIKFTSDKKIELQKKTPGDSIPNFNLFNKKQKKTSFKITGLQEIAITDSNANKVYWDTKKFSLLKGDLLKQNEVDENLTFRCVCEIK